MKRATRNHKVRIVHQAEMSECGLACLAMIANYHGHSYDLSAMRQKFKISVSGLSLRNIMSMANTLGLSSRALKIDSSQLSKIAFPAILHWNDSHFVVITGIVKGKCTIFDPATGKSSLTLDAVSKSFTGVVLEFTPVIDFTPEMAKSKIKITNLWAGASGFKRAVTQLVILSVVLQVFTLLAPLYLQFVVDEAILHSDKFFLLTLALGFVGVTVINALTEYVRGWVILFISQSLSFQMVGNVFHHLVRLKTSFFESRHIGDIISRISSLHPIREAMTQTIITAIIDGIMAVTTLCLMFLYSWKLTLIAITLTTFMVFISQGLTIIMRRRQGEQLIKSADEQTYILETIRSARAVKLFGREIEREGKWRNLYSDVVNANLSLGKLQIGNSLNVTFFLGLQLVAVVYVGALLVIQGQFSVGMLFAFVAYQNSFASRASTLVQSLVEIGMVRVHLGRLEDIIHARREVGLDGDLSNKRKVTGQIEASDLSFKYSDYGPEVFTNINLSVKSGEFIAITGVSGMGKTTLLKVILGLLEPSKGSVKIDNLDIKSFGLRQWRSEVGVVMQDDQLLTGTIAENISFFDPEMDMSRVKKCAEQAQIADEINLMTMRFNSMIGDMGAALSGGQRQRLLLARALYIEPSVLILDEGTANLDPVSESKIAEVISKMNITRIIIAHKPELIDRADRVLELSSQGLVEV